MAIFADSGSSIVAAAHWPISSPALKLSVANVASAASIGSSGVSRAITTSPASRASSIVGTIATVSLGVIMNPAAPAEMRSSIAVDLASLSPSNSPAKERSSTPSSSALAWAPSRILTKNGLDSVFVMSPTITPSPDGVVSPDGAVSPDAGPSAVSCAGGGGAAAPAPTRPATAIVAAAATGSARTGPHHAVSFVPPGPPARPLSVVDNVVKV